ncbi:alpha/beta hydrolase [Levilactobacillus zymae]|uniref:alpha/beta hydrolase n=1 Tax=Levilactobacillus zymae TaxID=267363 RepID=UPI0028BAF307|nr:alpha/beta hydrolase [Levilactobacillus zymae]MDT6981180.1 alpha/beta hydrolase [Levilactobacillus zymae]
MQHRHLWISVGISLLIILSLTGAWATHHQALRQFRGPQTRTATLLLPGDGGNWLSLRSMTLTLNQPHVATHSLTAHVASNGHVQWEQFHSVRADNPLIPVLFADNTHPQREAHQLVGVLNDLAKRYHITHVNFVGHSSGGTIALAYLNLPHPAAVTVNHLVCIGADFPGIPPLTRHYPKLQVLNLAGMIDAVPNDGEVPLSDARRLGPLVRGHVASYRFKIVHGHLWQVEHSLLHESAPVDRTIATFLYRPN